MMICIIGGGVIGLNLALTLATEHPSADIFLLEKEPFLGHHTSTRNSEVIHAGFAYPPDSLKTKFCVEGNRLTYALLDELGVPYKKCGKWIIAASDVEREAMERMVANAAAVGVPGFVPHTVADFLAEEPDAITIKGVIFSATSGVMDVGRYIRALESRLSSLSNVQIVYPCAIDGIDPAKNELATTRGPVPYDFLINSAGLTADDVYKMAGGPRNFQILPFKGEYYTWLKGNVRTMIYPVPKRFLDSRDKTLISSMGIHTHRNMDGELVIGPSQVKGGADQKFDYTIETPPEVFAENLGLFIKGVNAADLRAAYAGNRPKLYENGEAIGDFTIIREENRIHLLGIESPGLTAAPAIARHVLNLI